MATDTKYKIRIVYIRGRNSKNLGFISLLNNFLESLMKYIIQNVSIIDKIHFQKISWKFKFFFQFFIKFLENSTAIFKKIRESSNFLSFHFFIKFHENSNGIHIQKKSPWKFNLVVSLFHKIPWKFKTELLTVFLMFLFHEKNLNSNFNGFFDDILYEHPSSSWQTISSVG